MLSPYRTTAKFIQSAARRCALPTQHDRHPKRKEFAMSTVLTPAPAAQSRSARSSFVLKGVMQAPVTPLHDDFSVDYDGLAKMVDFHVRNGAPAIAWPHHKAESPNLTMPERKRGAEVLVKTVARRVPVSIFVGSLSEEDSLDLARH